MKHHDDCMREIFEHTGYIFFKLKKKKKNYSGENYKRNVDII